jgi:hypothetical protein
MHGFRRFPLSRAWRTRPIYSSRLFQHNIYSCNRLFSSGKPEIIERFPLSRAWRTRPIYSSRLFQHNIYSCSRLFSSGKPEIIERFQVTLQNHYCSSKNARPLSILEEYELVRNTERYALSHLLPHEWFRLIDIAALNHREIQLSQSLDDYFTYGKIPKKKYHSHLGSLVHDIHDRYPSEVHCRMVADIVKKFLDAKVPIEECTNLRYIAGVLRFYKSQDKYRIHCSIGDQELMILESYVGTVSQFTML